MRTPDPNKAFINPNQPLINELITVNYGGALIFESRSGAELTWVFIMKRGSNLETTGVLQTSSLPLHHVLNSFVPLAAQQQTLN